MEDISLDQILNRSLRDMGNQAIPKKEADSVEIEYKLNFHGYRSSKIDNQEVLILGCSHTEGHGLPIKSTWPYLLSQKMNMDYINLAKGGDGAQAQVTKAFQFFEEFYNPKYIFAVFPMARLEVPLIGVKTNTSDKKVGKAMFANNKIKKFSKAPHIAEDVLSEEFAFFYNFLFIKMLIQYCEANNIKLIWTHYQDSNVSISSFKHLHDGYFDSSFLEGPINDGCHADMADDPFFEYAADYSYWPPGHWGLHKQIHIAESIYNML